MKIIKERVIAYIFIIVMITLIGLGVYLIIETKDLLIGLIVLMGFAFLTGPAIYVGDLLCKEEE